MTEDKKITLFVWDELINEIVVHGEFAEHSAWNISWEYKRLLSNGTVVLHAVDANGVRLVMETWAENVEEAKYKFGLHPKYREMNPNE